MFLMESKLADGKGDAILDKCGFRDGWEVPQEGLNGGLLLGWMPNIKLNIQFSSKHILHADVLDNRGNHLSISFVYG